MFEAINPYFYGAQLGEEIIRDITGVMMMSDEERDIAMLIDPDPTVFLTLDRECLTDMLVNILSILN